MTEPIPLTDEAVRPVYRATGIVVERRAADGEFTPIGRGATDSVAEYMAAALDYLAADGRRRARTAAGITDRPPQSVRDAGQRIYVAALRRAYTQEASGGRETTGDSADLDYSHDEWEKALADYVKACFIEATKEDS